MSLRLCIIKPLKSRHPYNKDSLGMSQSVRIIGDPLYTYRVYIWREIVYSSRVNLGIQLVFVITVLMYFGRHF